MNVIFTCGGTGGHINPAIAVANQLRERHPECKILFIGAKGHMEEKLVPKAGYDLICLPGTGLSRKLNVQGVKTNCKAVANVLSAISQCKKIIRDFKPDVILGTGGYASFPALYVGSMMGIPTCVHESNAVPGLTTKMIAGRADKVLVAFAESAAYYPKKERVEVVGMPVRKEFITTKKASAKQALGLDHRPVVVSAFGSLGAKNMNIAMMDMFDQEQFANFPFQHIHATGTYGWEWMPEALDNLGIVYNKDSGIDVREYIYNMPEVMAAADVVISRAGASTCNEIGAAGKASILIPSPNVTNNHQEKNARILQERGAAVMVLESECTGEALFETVTQILRDPSRKEAMEKAARDLVLLDSSERICDILEKLSAGKEK